MSARERERQNLWKINLFCQKQELNKESFQMGRGCKLR